MSRKSKWFNKKARKNAARSKSRLGCEPLEDRRVLATLTVTSLADTGAGSLREAIATSNSNGESDTIMFDASVAGGTVSLTSGELTIGEFGYETSLVGSGETIDAGGLSRVINVNDSDGYAQSTTVNISNLTVTGGVAPAGYAGGGIQSGEILTVDNVTITGNSGDFGAGIANGNGILNLMNSMVTDNVGAYNGGGAYFAGTAHETTVTNTTISGNTIGSTNNGAYISTGAGIRVSDGTFSITDSTISGNTADTAGTLYDYGGFGGGAFVTGQDGYTHSATFTNTMILNNTATNGAADADVGRGGGIQTAGYSNVVLDGSTVDGSYSGAIGGNILFGGTSLDITNGSVISGGNATRGGALYAFSGGTVTISDSTIENNTARLFGGGLSVAPGADVTLDGATVQGNSVDAASGLPWGGGAFVGGAAGAGVAKLNVTNGTVFMNNEAPGRGGAIGSLPLGTAGSGEPGITWFEINVDGSTLMNNTAGDDGGAIHNARGGATNVTNGSVISGNTAADSGGAVNSFGFGCAGGECYDAGGTGQSYINVSDSVIDGNTSVYGQVTGSQYVDGNTTFQDGPSVVTIERSALINAVDGGGIDVTQSNLVLKESTLSGNFHSVDGAGLGLFVFVGYGGTNIYNVAVENSTVTANSSGAYAGGIYASYYGQVALQGSIVAGNSGTSGDVYDNANGANTAVDTIIGNNAGSGFAADGTLIGDVGAPVDPMLMPLGASFTHEPMPGSPAIDANNANTSAVDQRGAVRPWDSVANAAGGVADIGSHEYLSPVEPPPSASPDFNGDEVADCADIDALQDAIVNGGDVATFDADDNGVLDAADKTAWLAQAAEFNGESFSSYQQSDFNLDGVVDVSDFGIWNAAKFTTNAAHCAGDANVDGVVDVSDFGIWNAEKFTAAADSAAAASVVTAGANADALGQGIQRDRTGKLTERTTFGEALAKNTNARGLQFQGLRQVDATSTNVRVVSANQVNLDLSTEEDSSDRVRTASIDAVFSEL